MAVKKGFTLIEILVSIIIIGITVCVILPNFTASIEQTRAQAAKNNLLAIAAAEQRYSEDNNGNLYIDCIPGGCGDDKIALDTALHLNLMTNDLFGYYCTTKAIPAGSLYQCFATDKTDTLTLTVTTTGASVGCQPTGNNCPF